MFWPTRSRLMAASHLGHRGGSGSGAIVTCSQSIATPLMRFGITLQYAPQCILDALHQLEIVAGHLHGVIPGKTVLLNSHVGQFRELLLSPKSAADTKQATNVRIDGTPTFLLVTSVERVPDTPRVLRCDY
jgi:hypothetical protein